MLERNLSRSTHSDSLCIYNVHIRRLAITSSMRCRLCENLRILATVTISISFGHFVRDFTALASQGNSKVSPQKNCRGAMAPFPLDDNISRPFHTVTDSRSLAYVLPHMKENDL